MSSRDLEKLEIQERLTREKVIDKAFYELREEGYKEHIQSLLLDVQNLESSIQKLESIQVEEKQQTLNESLLLQENQVLKSQVHDLNQSLVESCKALDDKLIHLNENISENQELKNEIVNLQKVSLESNQQVQILQSQVHDLNHSLSESNKTLQVKVNDLNKKISENQELKKELSELEKECLDLKSELDAFLLMRKSIQESEHAKQDENALKTLLYDVLQKIYPSQASSLRDLKLQQHIEAFEAIMNDISFSFSKSKNGDFSLLKSTEMNLQKSDEIRELEEQINSLKAANLIVEQELQEKIEALEFELRTSKFNLSEFKEKVKELEVKLKEMETKTAELDKENQDMYETIQRGGKQNAKLQRNLEQAKEVIKKLSRDNEQLSTRAGDHSKIDAKKFELVIQNFEEKFNTIISRATTPNPIPATLIKDSPHNVHKKSADQLLEKLETLIKDATVRNVIESKTEKNLQIEIDSNQTMKSKDEDNSTTTAVAPDSSEQISSNASLERLETNQVEPVEPIVLNDSSKSSVTHSQMHILYYILFISLIVM